MSFTELLQRMDVLETLMKTVQTEMRALFGEQALRQEQTLVSPNKPKKTVKKKGSGEPKTFANTMYWWIHNWKTKNAVIAPYFTKESTKIAEDTVDADTLKRPEGFDRDRAVGVQVWLNLPVVLRQDTLKSMFENHKRDYEKMQATNVTQDANTDDEKKDDVAVATKPKPKPKRVVKAKPTKAKTPSKNNTTTDATDNTA
jgi:hypothetical protein